LTLNALFHILFYLPVTIVVVYLGEIFNGHKFDNRPNRPEHYSYGSLFLQKMPNWYLLIWQAHFVTFWRSRCFYTLTVKMVILRSLQNTSFCFPCSCWSESWMPTSGCRRLRARRSPRWRRRRARSSCHTWDSYSRPSCSPLASTRWVQENMSVFITVELLNYFHLLNTACASYGMAKPLF